jgi:hypothetical protein
LDGDEKFLGGTGGEEFGSKINVFLETILKINFNFFHNFYSLVG